jgi:hypothetical protein
MSHAMPELDDQHPPSHKGRIPDVPAGGQCRKAPIDAPDDVRNTAVGPDLVAWVADHHFVELRPSICAVLWFSHRRLATPSTARSFERAHGRPSQAVSCCRRATVLGASVRTSRR